MHFVACNYNCNNTPREVFYQLTTGISFHANKYIVSKDIHVYQVQ